MAERTSTKIEAFCAEAGYVIPSGFWRHPAGRYAVIDLSQSPPKLVAKTWQKQEDLVYYLNSLSEERPMRILDFKERRELTKLGAGVSPAGAF